MHSFKVVQKAFDPLPLPFEHLVDFFLTNWDSFYSLFYTLCILSMLFITFFSREHIHDFILFGHTLPFYLVGKKCRLSLNFFPRLHFSRAKYSCCFVIVAICTLLLWKIIFNLSEHISNDLDLS